MKEAEYIQFSWFSDEFVNQNIEQIYQELVGTGAKTLEWNDNDSSEQPFLSSACGNSGELNHLVRFNHQRLDLIVRNSITPNDGNGSKYPIQNVESKLDMLIDKISMCELNGIKNAKRLALNISLNEISENETEINNKFLNLCPLQLSVKNDSLLSFRINKPRNIDNIHKINRVVNYQINYLESNENIKNKLYLLNVFLDFNTNPEHSLEVGIHNRIWNRLRIEAIVFMRNPNVVFWE